MSSRAETYWELHHQLSEMWGEQMFEEGELSDLLATDPSFIVKLKNLGVAKETSNIDSPFLWFNLSETVRIAYAYVMWYHVYGADDTRSDQYFDRLTEALALQIPPYVGQVASVELYEDEYLQEAVWMISRYGQNSDLVE